MTVPPPNRLLAGGHNFRDLGGYTNRHGQTVARGRVFRSGLLTHLTDDDHQVMNDLGIRVICDLRTTKERAARPSRLPRAPAFAVWERDHVSSTADLVSRMAKPGFGGDDTRHMMTDLYRELAYEQAPSYKAIFEKLSQGELPLVFHCSAGKDRTGIAAALVLTALGVPYDTVRQDFLLSNGAPGMETLAGSLSPGLNRLPPDVAAPLIGVEGVYLDNAFEQLRKDYGSVEGYMQQELGVGPGEIAALRKRMLD